MPIKTVNRKSFMDSSVKRITRIQRKLSGTGSNRLPNVEKTVLAQSYKNQVIENIEEMLHLFLITN